MFVIIDENRIDFTKSVFLCLQKSDSQSYLLPFSQSPAELYVISAYDLEKDGLLTAGEAYPATTSTQVIPGPGMITELPETKLLCQVLETLIRNIIILLMCHIIIITSKYPWKFHGLARG